MWVKNLVKLAVVLHFIVMSTRAEENENVEVETLPNIWEDEAVSRMVRDLLARDLLKEHDQKQTKRQHKRDVVYATSPTPKSSSTTRKITVSTQKAKKPTRVGQTGNKTKNRVTSAPSTAATKAATVKPSAKPIVSNLGSAANISKSKVSC